MFRWVVTGLSLQSLGTDSCLVCVGDLWWTKWHWGTLPFLTLKSLVSGGSQQSDCQSLSLEHHEGLVNQFMPFPVNRGCCFCD